MQLCRSKTNGSPASLADEGDRLAERTFASRPSSAAERTAFFVPPPAKFSPAARRPRVPEITLLQSPHKLTAGDRRKKVRIMLNFATTERTSTNGLLCVIIRWLSVLRDRYIYALFLVPTLCVRSDRGKRNNNSRCRCGPLSRVYSAGPLRNTERAAFFSAWDGQSEFIHLG